MPVAHGRVFHPTLRRRLVSDLRRRQQMTRSTDKHSFTALRQTGIAQETRLQLIVLPCEAHEPEGR